MFHEYKWSDLGKIFMFIEFFWMKCCIYDVPEKLFAESTKMATIWLDENVPTTGWSSETAKY